MFCAGSMWTPVAGSNLSLPPPLSQLLCMSCEPVPSEPAVRVSRPTGVDGRMIALKDQQSGTTNTLVCSSYGWCPRCQWDHQSCCHLLAHPLNGGHVASSGSGRYKYKYKSGCCSQLNLTQVWCCSQLNLTQVW